MNLDRYTHPLSQEEAFKREQLEHGHDFWKSSLDTDNFNPKSIDIFVAKLHPDPNQKELKLKWMVVDEKLIVFPDRIEHVDMYSAMARLGIYGDLHAGGHLKYLRDTGANVCQRLLYGYSDSLERHLSRQDSEEYKRGPLAFTVGDHFRIV